MWQVSQTLTKRFLIVLIAAITLALSGPLTALATTQENSNFNGVTCTWYRIRRGDTLTKISIRFGVSIRMIQQANGLRTTRIYSGRNLCIPTYRVTPKPPPCDWWNCPPPPPVPQPCPWACPPPVQRSVWKAEFFQGLDTINGPLIISVNNYSTRNDFVWPNGSPYWCVPGGNWSVRLTQSVYLPGGSYTFWSASDYGVLVWLDSDLVINNWSTSPAWNASGSTHAQVAPGQHLITVAYRHIGGPGQLHLNWARQ